MMLRKILVFLNVDIAYFILTFVNSVLSVRLMGAQVFGQLTYLLAILAFVPSFYSVFDVTLTRFTGSIPARDQRQLFIFVLSCKIAVFLVAACAVAVWYFSGADARLAEILHNPYLLLFGIASVVILPMELLSRSFESVMRSLEMYRQTLSIRLSQAISLLALNLVLWVTITRGEDVLLWRAGHVLLSGMGLLFFVTRSLHRKGWFRKIRQAGATSFRESWRAAYVSYFRPYSQPLSVGSLFEYLKANLPSLLLAHSSNFQNVTYYKVFYNIFQIVKTLLPKVADTLLPSVVRLKASGAAFERKFIRYSRIYLALIGVIALLTFAFHPYLLKLYGLPLTWEASWTSLLFSWSLVVASLGFIFNYLILLGKDTSPHYYIASVGGGVYVGLQILLTPFGIIGASTAVLARGLVTNFQYQYYVVNKFGYMSRRNLASLLAIFLFFSALIFAVALIMGFIT